MAPNDRSSSRPNSGGGAGKRRSGPPPRGGSAGKSPGGAGGGRGRPSSGRGGDQGGRGRPAAAEDRGPATAGPASWGSLGRKGAGRLKADEFDARDSVGAVGRDTRPAPDREHARWVRVDDVRTEAEGAVQRGKGAGSPPRREERRPAPKASRGRSARKAGAGTGGADARAELVAALGAQRGDRANQRLRDAAHAFERERYEEARTLLKPLAEQAPQAVTVRELLGLTYYRLGRWKDAVRELEAFRTMTDSAEQHPVLADAYRGLRRHREVEDLWEELRAASLSGDLVTEGRIVMAGSFADRGDLASAIALLEKAHRAAKRAEVHHLRQGYALGDLYERAGDAARARELFRWVVLQEPDFADAAERASSLS